MSGLDEKAVLAACEAYHADLPTHDYPSRWAMERAISAYLASATPADVGELVERYRKLEQELSSTKNTDLRFDIKEDIAELVPSFATALERVVRERDEALARLQTAYQVKADMNDLANAERHARLIAEAKLAEARKVIEPFAAAARAIGNEPGAVQFYTDTGYRELPEDALRAARRWIEETK